MKPTADQDQLNDAINSVDEPTEIHVHKDYFKSMRDQGFSGTVGAKDMPVKEGPIGSTQQIGQYGQLPVFSHGRLSDHVYVHGEEDGGDWFRNGECVDEPGQAPIGNTAKPVVV